MLVWSNAAAVAVQGIQSATCLGRGEVHTTTGILTGSFCSPACQFFSSSNFVWKLKLD
jgi:hypothetical protein